MADFDPGTGLGPRLRLVRSSGQLSVGELARRVGCSASLISQIERGVSVPSVGVLYSLATELGSSLDYLLFGSGTVPAEAPAVAAAPPPPIVQRGCDRRIIDLASGVRWERLTPQSEAMTDFLEVIYSPGGHSTDERGPLRHADGQRGLRELRAGPARLDRVRFLDAARVPQQDRRRRARDLGRRAFRARPRLTPRMPRPELCPELPQSRTYDPPVP